MADPGPAATLLLTRHGRTAWNAEGRAQGHADVPLDETGRWEAARLGEVLLARGVDRLWSSDLSRASQTAAAITAAGGPEATYDARLREFDVGERQGLTVPEFRDRFPDQADAWVGFGDHAMVPGAETTPVVRERVTAAMRDCLAALSPGQTGVVVMHGAALRVGLFELLGWSWDRAASVEPLRNAHWAEVSCRAGDAPRLRAYNVGR